MEMRAIEDIAISQDLTLPLPPLASALHDSALNSHCSACFSPLPPHPFTPVTPSIPINPYHFPPVTPAVLYCSPRCSNLDSTLHLSSAESHVLHLFRQAPPSSWDDSSDLRLSLRLLHIFQKRGENNGDPFRENVNIELPYDHLVNKRYSVNKMEGYIQKNCLLERIAGLMTNRERLMIRGEYTDGNDEFESVFGRIRDGAKAMAMARKMCSANDVHLDSEKEEFVEEEMLLCLVLTNAVELQPVNGRSIGIAVYGTTFSWINHSCSPNACYRFSIGMEHFEQENGDGVIMGGDKNATLSGKCGYGPKVIVRSIKALTKGEEVTIAYTDLLQPKEIRQAELWLKYKFKCCCKRCSAAPATRVDCSLQAICTANADSPSTLLHHEYSAEEIEIEKLMEDFDDAITDYLSFNNPELCCEKLENLLTHGSSRKLKLHPFHHVSINAYTTLASAYKVRSNELLASNKLQAFNMGKLSAAYSLLLAGVSHHLFTFESSLITSASNFWINAGESLLNLSRTFLCDKELSSPCTKNCRDWFLANVLEPNSVDINFEDVTLEELNRQQLNCAANISSRIWSKLSCGSCFLKLIRNPIDFRWVESAESFAISDGFSEENGFEQVRRDIMNLSCHCLKHGAFLSSICYGFPFSSSAEMYDRSTHF